MDEHDEPNAVVPQEPNAVVPQEPNAVVPQEPDADAPQESIDADADPPLITATGLGVDGEHGPLFSGVDLALTAGLSRHPDARWTGTDHAAADAGGTVQGEPRHSDRAR